MDAVSQPITVVVANSAALTHVRRRGPAPKCSLKVPTPLPMRDNDGNFRAGSLANLDEVEGPSLFVCMLVWIAALLTGPFRCRERRSLVIAQRFRVLIHRLGGLWVPFAQLLSRQTVQFSQTFCEEIKQTRYPPVEFEFQAARKIIEAQLEAPLERLFVAFDETPLGTLPYAQNYRARIRRRGRIVNVIVRVLEPGARERLAKDMVRIRRVTGMLKTLKILPECYIGEMLDELDATRIELTDYRFELAHLKRLRTSLRAHDIQVVKVFRRYSGEKVFTTEFIPAPSLHDVREARQRAPDELNQWCQANDISLKKVGRRLLESYMRQLCEEPEFDRHLPPHHVLLLKKSRIALVGIRSARSLHRSFRTTYGMFLLSMARGDSAKAADCLFLLCDALPPVDLTDAKREVTALFRSYSARVRLFPAGPDEKSLCQLFREILCVLERYQIHVSWQFFDVQLGWSKLDESLRLTIPEENMLKRLLAYFEQARRREWKAMKARGFSANAATLTLRLSEIGSFHLGGLRRSARVFQAVVGKGAFVFAGFLNSLKWVVCAAGLFALSLCLNQYLPGFLPDGVASRLTETSQRIGQLPFGTWLVTLGGVFIVVVILTSFRRKFLVPEPVGLKKRGA